MIRHRTCLISLGMADDKLVADAQLVSQHSGMEQAQGSGTKTPLLRRTYTNTSLRSSAGSLESTRLAASGTFLTRVVGGGLQIQGRRTPVLILIEFVRPVDC